MGRVLLAILVLFILVHAARAAAHSLKTDPAAAAGPGASPPPPGVHDLGGLLEPIRARHKVPALGAAVLHGDRVIALGIAGVRKAGGPETVTADDLWHLGSCTKAMTATLIALLVEEGTLSWDQSVGEFFRERGEKVHEDWDAVLLEQLLAHTSGVAGQPPRDLWGRLWTFKGTPSEARMELVRGTLPEKPGAAPGVSFEYSNTGYAIAGAMAEQATGKAWEDLMRERVFAPLGITTAGFGPPGTATAVDQPRGHTGRGKAVEPGPAADNPPAIGPAGTAHMSLDDWAKFIAAHLLRSGAGLPEAAYRRLHTPPEGRDYALGWIVTKRPWAKGGGEGAVLTHAGSNTMWHAVAWLAPERGFAVLITCNQGGNAAAKACDDAAGALIKAHAPPETEPPPTHPQ